MVVQVQAVPLFMTSDVYDPAPRFNVLENALVGDGVVAPAVSFLSGYLLLPLLAAPSEAEREPGRAPCA